MAKSPSHQVPVVLVVQGSLARTAGPPRTDSDCHLSGDNERKASPADTAGQQIYLVEPRMIDDAYY